MDEPRRDARSPDNEGSDDAAWAALVAAFHTSSAGHPWPDAEDLPADTAQSGGTVPPLAPSDRPRGVPDDDGLTAPPESTGPREPDGPHDLDPPGKPTRTGDQDRPGDSRRIFSGDQTAATPWRQHIPEEGSQEHFVPPVPPPLPPTDAITRLAWIGAFGGPAYLLVATLLGWHVAGWAAVLAVVAFVGGFGLLVLGMKDGSGPDDNGAVV